MKVMKEKEKPKGLKKIELRAKPFSYKKLTARQIT
jgi:hypothetical protein